MSLHLLHPSTQAAALAAACALGALALPAVALGEDDEHVEVRTSARCGSGATAKLRLRARDDVIDVRFEIDHDRRGVVWRLALVQERRVVWKGKGTTGPSGSLEVRRRLRDLEGTDSVTAQAWGPGGTMCRMTASLSDVAE